MTPVGRRLADIEILRAIAIVLVIIEHTKDDFHSSVLAAITRWGGFGCGVDLFFVISGFVIARSLLPAIWAGRTARSRVLLAFWVRRAWRLWPAAWAWLLIILAGSLILPDRVFGTVRTNIWATIAGVLNFANARVTYSFGHYDYGASYPYWSLSVEEQFYLIFPLLALMLGRAVAVAALAFMLLHVTHNNSILDWPFRGAGLCYGVLLAMLPASLLDAIEPRRLTPVLSALLTAALLLAALRVDADEAAVPFRYSLLAVIGSVLVWLASYDRGYVWPVTVARPALMWLGARSYALYLVHAPVLRLLRLLPVGGAAAWWTNRLVVITALGAIGLLAELTYRTVERPMRRRGRTIAARIDAPSTAAA